MVENIRVKPILESLDYIQKEGASVARFGDGEIDLINGHSIPYQSYHPELAAALQQILQTPSSSELLVCLPDVFQEMDRYNRNAVLFWESHLQKYQHFYESSCRSPWYGSTFLSRPYIDLADKSQSPQYFAGLKQLWKGKEILLVEGETTRSGVGNDLFAQAASIKRIIGPSKDAFDVHEEIFEAILRNAQKRLVLLMLGPTAKVLVKKLQDRGIQAIDLGHIDSEYEWFQMGATHKVKFSDKHTAEFNHDEQITAPYDSEYESQILEKIGTKNSSTAPLPLVSVIVAFHNGAASLERLLDSLRNQDYPNLEILLINASSTDTSALICQKYVSKDARASLVHLESPSLVSARNFGVEQACGDYIGFVEAEDFLDKSYTSTLVSHLVEKHSKIIAAPYVLFREESKKFLFYSPSPHLVNREYSIQEWLEIGQQSQHPFPVLFHHLGMKLFHHSLFESVRFKEEGDSALLYLYLKAQSIYLIDSALYMLGESQGTKLDVLHQVRALEEQMALLATLGYSVASTVEAYKACLETGEKILLGAGRIQDYQSIHNKRLLVDAATRRD